MRLAEDAERSVYHRGDEGHRFSGWSDTQVKVKLAICRKKQPQRKVQGPPLRSHALASVGMTEMGGRNDYNIGAN